VTEVEQSTANQAAHISFPLDSAIDRRQLVAVLEREAEHVALNAATIFTSGMSEFERGAGSWCVLSTTTPGSHEALSDNGHGSHDESIPTLEEGFQRFGRVVVLAVLCDEPKLVSDDLVWLRDMLRARDVEVDYPLVSDLLLNAFLKACSSILTPGQALVVGDVFERAKQSLSTWPR
jgi:hypothetical protein